MKDKDLDFQDLCADIIELVTNNLLNFTKNESQTLKVIKVAIERSLNSKNKI